MDARHSDLTSSSSVAMFLLGTFAGALIAKVLLTYRAQVYDPASPPQYAPTDDHNTEEMIENGTASMTIRSEHDEYYAGRKLRRTTEQPAGQSPYRASLGDYPFLPRQTTS